MKNFFKGKAFKCIMVLLVIVLIAGIFLAFCNSLFYVSAEERLSRAISKLYDTNVTAEELDLEDKDGKDLYNCNPTGYATITNIYYVYENGDIVVKAKGVGGFGGSVTTWVAVENDKTKITGIGSVLAQASENTSESLLSNLSDENFEQFSYDYEEGKLYEYGYLNGGTAHGDNYIPTGASMTYRGVCNAVNGAIEFVNENIEDIMIQVSELLEEAAA